MPILNIFKEHKAEIVCANFSISNRCFLSIDSDGILVERMFTNSSGVTVRKVHEKLKPVSVAISPDDSMELVGFKNGFIQARSLLKKSKKNVNVYFRSHTSSIRSISFNALGNYFLTSGDDGKIKLWQTKDLQLVREVDTFIKEDDLTLSIPACFSPLNDVFVYESAKNILTISDIQGKNIKTVLVPEGIKEVHFTEKQDVVAVLTRQGKLEFYSISKKTYLGTMPFINEISISSFSVNIITGNILVSTKEGEVYLCNSTEMQNIEVVTESKEKKTESSKKESSHIPLLAHKMPLKLYPQYPQEEHSPPLKKEGENSHQREEHLQEEVSLPLSQNVLEYWGLEDEVNIEGASRTPFFPIKDETPLEEPLIFLSHTENQGEKIQAEPILEQTVFDEGVEFQSSMQEDETSYMQDGENEDYEDMPEDDYSNVLNEELSDDDTSEEHEPNKERMKQ